MKLLPCAIPSPPHWTVDWLALNDQFDWIRAMKDCPQDTIHHAEGDVWIHVHMVCEAMASLEEWQALPAADRELLFAAALLHDVAKPACTRIEDGRITSRGHSQRGAIQTRQLLWRTGADLLLREQLCALVRYHQTPFHAIDNPDAARLVRRISQSTRCDLLAILAKSDALGRHCADQSSILTKVGLFRELAREHDCLDKPFAFPSSLSRFEYFRREDRDPHYAVHDSSKFEVLLMSGLPGSGKDTWIRTYAAGLPVISLDDIREEIGAPLTGNQGRVIQLAKERARAYLRQQTSFVWNATNLSRDIRTPLIDLFTDYQARVRIVYIEAPYEKQILQNQQRSRAVPPDAIEHMTSRWEVPDVTEAPIVEWCENGASWAVHL